MSKFAAMAATECLAHDLASVGAAIKVSALCPGLVDTGISRSRRNRPAALDTPQSDSGAFVEQALVDGTAGSMSPAAVADLVVEAIRAEHFLVPTRPSYAGQLADRTEDLIARNAAPQPHVRLTPTPRFGVKVRQLFAHFDASSWDLVRGSRGGSRGSRCRGG